MPSTSFRNKHTFYWSNFLRMPSKRIVIRSPVVFTCAALKQHLFAIHEEYSARQNSGGVFTLDISFYNAKSTDIVGICGSELSQTVGCLSNALIPISGCQLAIKVIFAFFLLGYHCSVVAAEPPQGIMTGWRVCYDIIVQGRAGNAVGVEMVVFVYLMRVTEGFCTPTVGDSNFNIGHNR